MKNQIKKLLKKIVDIIIKYDMSDDDKQTIAACVAVISEYLEVMDER